MALSAPALAAGNRLTVTVTTFDATAPDQSFALVTLAKRLKEEVALRIAGEYVAELLEAISVKLPAGPDVDTCHLYSSVPV